MNIEQEHYDIDKILDETIVQDRPHYLVKWKGFSSIQSTWEPIQNLIHALGVVHNWKINNSCHSSTKGNQWVEKVPDKTKKIIKRGHNQTLKDLQMKLNGQKKKKRKRKSIILSSDEQESNSSSHQWKKEINSSQHLSKNKRNASRGSRSNKNIYKCQSPLKSKHEQKDYEMADFKIVGKVTKQTVKKIISCFEWDNTKLCSVQLKDGRRTNMRRQDVKKICPEKLVEFFEKKEKNM